MKNFIKLFTILAIMMLSISSCSLCGVDGTEEGVFIKKPMFFGKGGVEMEALTEGSKWKVFTTDFVRYPSIPMKYTEAFNDVFCNDNTPLDLSAHITLELEKGCSPILHVNYGPQWYDYVVKEAFREAVRNFISTYDMYTLTSNREVYEAIKVDITDKLETYFSKISEDKKFPIHIVNVIVDKAKPNDEVLVELNKTAAMIQAKQTQIQQQQMETERRKTEELRAKADKEYRSQMGLSASEFIQLRTLEVIENKPNAEIDVLFGTTPDNTMWNIKRNQ